MNWTDQLKSARNVSVPLVGINTPDPEATIRVVCNQVVNDKSPKITWDVVNGLSGRNESGAKVAAQMTGEYDETKGTPVECLVKAKSLPQESVLFVHLAPRWRADACSPG